LFRIMKRKQPKFARERDGLLKNKWRSSITIWNLPKKKSTIFSHKLRRLL